MVFCLVSCLEGSCVSRRLGILGARVLGLVYYVWIPFTISRVAEGLRPITTTSLAYIVQFICGMWRMHESGTSLSTITSSNCSVIDCPHLPSCNQDSRGCKFCEMLRRVDLQIYRRFGDAYRLLIQVKTWTESTKKLVHVSLNWLTLRMEALRSFETYTASHSRILQSSKAPLWELCVSLRTSGSGDEGGNSNSLCHHYHHGRRLYHFFYIFCFCLPGLCRRST